jgi:antitoxin (DNA-binding transcriptional repressor) of toxin-antitoxin stability system
LSVRVIEVGAFDAKTHLSQLLDEVEGGAVVRISRRGRFVAVLKADATVSRENALEALTALRSLVPDKVPVETVLGLRDEGRER